MPAGQYFEFQRLFMLPVAVMWNLDGCIAYYRRVLNELRRRYDDNSPTDSIGSREKYRLMWEGITIWYKVDLYYWLAEKGARFVYEQYTDSFGIRRRKTTTFPETLRQIAREIITLPYTLNLEKRIAWTEKKIDEYNIDGVVLHANLSCRPAAAAQQDVKNAIQKSKGVPVLILSADMDDPRSFSDEQVRTRCESFIEIMAAKQP
jgi:benzoyl-CoA reductase/2-hydroxyglutaryl-CoA dehydratase subunit BcrC/BadD/HgdB